jgi:TPR repeat protein
MDFQAGRIRAARDGRVRAHALLVEAANAGNGVAARRLGDVHRVGLDGLVLSPEKSRRWYARSALDGDRSGANNLGVCFERGLGGPKDPRQAVYWYGKAARARLGCAASNLGYCHLRGFGVPRDESMALYWFNAALEHGHARAEDWVAHLRAGAASADSLPKAFAQQLLVANPPAQWTPVFGLRPLRESSSFFVDVTELVVRHGMDIMLGDVDSIDLHKDLG